MLYVVIVGAEIGFWVFLGAGLAVRYLLRMRRLGAILLVLTPVTDLVLLAATAIDLAGGATPSFAHGLAAAYLGFSVAFGHTLVRWADQRVAHRFAGGPPPWRPPKSGWARARYDWREWGKGMIGWAIACGLLLAGIALVGDPARTGELWGWIARLSAVMGIWLVIDPLWSTGRSLLDPSFSRADAG